MRRTPLQRTRRKRRAAERDALSHLDRPSRGLRSVQRRWPGHGKPRAGLPCRGLDRHRSGHRRKRAVPPGLTLQRRAVTTDFREWRCRATARTQAPAGIEPAAPWPPLRGKREALNITAPSAKCSQSLTSSLGGCTAARPAGSQKGRLCLAPLRVGRCAGFARAAQQPVGALAAAPPTRIFSQALRAKVEWCPAHPGPSAARACGPAGLRSRARSQPSRPPRQRGSPKSKATPQSPCAARHKAASQRTAERVPFVAVKAKPFGRQAGLDGVSPGGSPASP